MWAIPLLLTILLAVAAAWIWPTRETFITGIQQLAIIVLAGWGITLVWAIYGNFFK